MDCTEFYIFNDLKGAYLETIISILTSYYDISWWFHILGDLLHISSHYAKYHYVKYFHIHIFCLDLYYKLNPAFLTAKISYI